MKAIYQPTGRAAEYSPLAVNLYWGCNHGCSYCYAPGVLRRKPEEFHASVRPREHILEKLDRDARQISGDRRQILLSFLCDPYPTAYGHGLDPADITRQALQILAHRGLNATILTKGGIRAARDFDLLAENSWTFGTSLVWWRDPVRATYEPNAAAVGSRVEAIRIARRMGIKTWVSLEPVIDLQEALLVISNLAEEVDSWWIGALNHHTRAYSIDEWAEFKGVAEFLLRRLAIIPSYKFKQETWTTNP